MSSPPPGVTTDEYWTYSGTDLATYGWGCGTVGGTRYSLPPLRGDNARVANAPGDLWLPKMPDARTITLQMWTVGADPDTGARVDDPRRRFNDNWNYLRQLFWNPDAESRLERRWSLTDANGQPGIAWAEALAQLAPGQDVQPKMNGRNAATFEVPLHLAHPFFYGPTITTTLAVGAPVTVTNPGSWSAWSRFVYLDLVGPLAAPRVTNTSRGVYCGLPGTIGAAETVTLDVAQWIALSAHSATGPKSNRTGEIYNAGTAAWMALARGSQQLLLTAAGSGIAGVPAGHAVLRFRPPYV